jgi:hypothetical protein
MRIFQTVIAAGALLFAGSASAQSASNFAAGWRQFDGSGGGYINAATLMRCPQTLGDGYNLFRADVYASSTDVSCGYKLGDDSANISFYFYPAQGSIQDELASTSRPVLDRYGPRSAQRESQRDWILPSGTVKAVALEVVPAGEQGQSFALVDVAGRRLKARETWTGASGVSHGVADRFFALQAEALANAQTCAALPVWGGRRKARLSGDPMTAAMTGGFLLGAVATSATAVSDPNAPKPCIMGSLGRSDRGSTLLLSRTGNESVKIALDDQPDGNFIAGLTNISLGPALQLPGDSQYFLYSQEGRDVAVFRAYRTLPSWEQILADMVSVATNTLTPLVVAKPKVGETGSNITLNTGAIDDEKAKRRPGTR